MQTADDEIMATACQGDYRPQEEAPTRVCLHAVAAGFVAGVLLAAIGAGFLAQRTRTLNNAEMAREERLWLEAADRAYAAGVVAGARLANPVQGTEQR